MEHKLSHLRRESLPYMDRGREPGRRCVEARARLTQVGCHATEQRS